MYDTFRILIMNQNLISILMTSLFVSQNFNQRFDQEIKIMPGTSFTAFGAHFLGHRHMNELR